MPLMLGILFTVLKSWYTDLVVGETSSYDNHCGKNYSKVKLKEKKRNLYNWTEV